MTKNLKKNSYEGEICIIVPQEIPENYHKLPVAFVRWQPYLNPIHYGILTYIVSRIHQRRCYAFPSIKTAAEECNICENSFNKGVNLLEALGLIAVERSAKGNKYFLRQPVEPNLNLIEHYLDKKAVEKFKKRQVKDKNESSLNFKKVHYFKAKKENSYKIQSRIYSDTSKSLDEIPLTHEMPTNKIQTNLNLANSNLNSGDNKFQKNKKGDVVDLDKVKRIKSYGIASKRAKELSKNLNPDIRLDSFISYILKDVGKSVDIKNTTGFLIHGLSELQEDYLDLQREKDKLEMKKTKKEKITNNFIKLKNDVENKANTIYSNFDEKIRNNIWRELVKEHEYLHENMTDELKEGFYLDYIYREYFKLNETDLNLLSADPKLVSENDLNLVKEKWDSLQLE